MALKKKTYQQWIISRSSGFAGWIFTVLLLLCTQFAYFSAKAQCTFSTPNYTFDLTGHPDTTVSSPSVSRGGSCSSCGSNCVLIKVTLDSKASGFIFNVSGGAGGTTYTFGCGTSSPVSGTVGGLKCVSGTGPFTITFCKPGSNKQTYSIQSVTNPYLKNTVVYLPKSCKAKLQVYGLVKSSITWASISGSAYNSNLSCTSGCDTPYVSYSSGFPSYVDYKVCGTPVNTCYASSWCDTVRVYYDTPLSISLSPKTGKVCGAGKNTTIQSTVTGGLAPYTYSWKSGSTVVSTSSSLTASVGTYYLSVKDSLGCTAYTDTAFIVADPSVVKANAGNDTTICASVNRVSLHGTVSFATTGKWSGGTGTYFPNDTTLITTYIPSQTEIDAGFVDLTLTTTGISPCVAATDVKRITISPDPTPVVSGPSIACSNKGGYVYSTPNVSGHTYAWTVAGGTISSGQGTNSITVTWGSAGPGYVYVKETSAAGCYEVSSLNPLSKFDFNTNPITHATTGPDGFYKEGAAYSEGMGATIMSGCGGSKGLDLVASGTTMMRGKLCVDFRFQRDESDADFLLFGGMTFMMKGGVIYVQYYVDNGSGGYTVVGPTSTGYTVPNDDTYRSFSFCYDSASGVARAYVDGSQIWVNSTTTAGKSLNWTSASSINIGNIMDGNCSYRALLDYTNIGVPVSVVDAPTAPTLSTADTICSGTTVAYSVAANSSVTYQWGAPGGQIIGSNTGNSVTVQWVTVGTGTLVLYVTDKASGCVSTSVRYTTIVPKPNTTKILH
jgi:hypothetical protein